MLSTLLWRNKPILTKFTGKPGFLAKRANSGKFTIAGPFWKTYSSLTLRFLVKLMLSVRFLTKQIFVKQSSSCAPFFPQVSPKTEHRCLLHFLEKTSQFSHIYSSAHRFPQGLAQTAPFLVKLILSSPFWQNKPIST